MILHSYYYLSKYPTTDRWDDRPKSLKTICRRAHIKEKRRREVERDGGLGSMLFKRVFRPT